MRWPSSATSAGIALFVDAIQGLGPLRIDVRRTPIDFLAADGHKWLLGPEGAGFLYVRRRLDRPAPADRRRLAQRRRVVQLARARVPAQAERPALGGRLVQHARPAGVRRQPRPVPRDGASMPSRGGSSTGPRPVRELAAVGRLDGPRLDARPEDRSAHRGPRARRASIPPPRRRELRRRHGDRRRPAGGGGCGSARTSTTTTTTCERLASRTWPCRRADACESASVAPIATA